MDARSLARPAPIARPDDEVSTSLAAMVAAGLPGLVVQVGADFVVVPASQVLRVALPRYVLDDAALGRVWDEASADAIARRLAGRRVRDLIAALDRNDDGPSHAVAVDATVVELAAVMASAHVPLVAVTEHGRLLGVVTVNDLLGRLLA
ncbi:MAG: hypothetical protein QG597_4930 [Actinomycetota bacterium]|nr:hypothetical protein [Actinomycetota bacterium]